MRATSLRLWNKLPEGLLGRSFESWHRLGYKVQLLVLRLAEEQNSKCFFCSNGTGLFIDHEHYPGIKEKVTVYNIRGLLCPRCNSHISYIEQEEVLGFTNFENAECWLSSSDVETYKYLFDQRVIEFREADLEEEMGGHRYLERGARLSQIEYWRESASTSQWEPFEHAKFRQRMKHTRFVAAYFLTTLRYIAKQFEADPNYDPPENVRAFIEQITPLMDEIVSRGQQLPKR